MAVSEKEFLKTCTEQMRCKAMREIVEQELAAHIEDQKEAYMQEGMEEAEAQNLAVKQMGDPVEIGVGLDRVHRPRMDWKTFGVILLLSAMGFCVQLLMRRQGIGADQNQFFTYIKSSAAGITLMCLTCFVDYTVLGKYPRLIWCLMTAAGMVIGLSSTVINGGKRYGWFIMLLVVSYGGIVFYYHKQGILGILKALGWMFGSYGLILLAAGTAPSGGCAKLWMFGCLVMLGFAAVRGWYGKHRWIGIVLLGAPAFVSIAAAGYLLVFGANYQAERIRVMLSPQKYHAGSGFLLLEVREAFQNLKLFSASTNLSPDRIPYLAEPENYVMLWIAQNYGLAAGIFVVTVLTLLAVLTLWGIRRQQNRLGMIVGVGCLFVFFLPVVVNVLMNTGYSWSTSCALPFLSMSGKENVSLYILMGLLLSVFRNQTSLPEPKAKSGYRLKLVAEKE